jgi:hypothetical protein
MPDELPLEDDADAAQDELALDLPDDEEGDMGEMDRT